MIEVNVWLSTAHLFGKPIKHGILGPLFTHRKRGEHFGHVNFLLKIDERSENYSEIEANQRELVMQKSLSNIPNALTTKEQHNIYAQKMVKSATFTHSFWPSERSTEGGVYYKSLLYFMHLGPPVKGVKPLFSTHEEDMDAENTPDGISIVKHQPNKKIQAMSAELKMEIQALNAETLNLEIALQNRNKWESKINQLTADKSTLLEDQVTLTARYEESVNNIKEKNKALTCEIEVNARSITSLSRKISYIKPIANPDDKTKHDLNEAEKEIQMQQQKQQQVQVQLAELAQHAAQLKTTYENQFQLTKNKIETIIKDIGFLQSMLKQALAVIGNRNENIAQELRATVTEKEDLLQRKEAALNNIYVTSGRRPDHAIHLPTSDGGYEFYIDEIAVLKAMESEKSQNYAILSNHCAISAKRCLLAGINENMKKHLKQDAGFPEKFFRLQTIETCVSFSEWTMSLQNGLLKLNFPAKPSTTPAVI